MQHINFWTIHPSITFIDRLFIISWVWLAIRKTPIISCGNVSNMRWDDVLLLPFQRMHQKIEKYFDDTLVNYFELYDSIQSHNFLIKITKNKIKNNLINDSIV